MIVARIGGIQFHKGSQMHEGFSNTVLSHCTEQLSIDCKDTFNVIEYSIYSFRRDEAIDTDRLKE